MVSDKAIKVLNEIESGMEKNHEQSFRCCPASDDPAQRRGDQFFQRVDGCILFWEEKM